MTNLAEAYSSGAAAWAGGPARVYRRLAEQLVGFSPVPLAGHLVLDLGSGTGLGSAAASAVGARVVATDISLGMLENDRATRPPASVGDMRELPFRTGAFDLVLAAFALNHLDDPVPGLREAARVADVLLASTYAADDDHPAKLAVELALGEVGWEAPGWYRSLKEAMARWGAVPDATAALERGGLHAMDVERREIGFPELGPADLVAWRLGLAQHAPFVRDLDLGTQTRVFERALELLGADPEPLVRRVIFLAARAGDGAVSARGRGR